MGVEECLLVEVCYRNSRNLLRVFFALLLFDPPILSSRMNSGVGPVGDGFRFFSS